MAITDEEIQRMRESALYAKVAEVMDQVIRLCRENAELRDTVWEQTDKALNLVDLVELHKAQELHALTLANAKLAKAREALRKLDDAVSCNCLYGPDRPWHADECVISIIDKLLKELSE